MNILQYHKFEYRRSPYTLRDVVEDKCWLRAWEWFDPGGAELSDLCWDFLNFFFQSSRTILYPLSHSSRYSYDPRKTKAANKGGVITTA